MDKTDNKENQETIEQANKYLDGKAEVISQQEITKIIEETTET